MNEEKIYELMTKMYADLKDTQEKTYAEMQEGFKRVDERFSSVEERLTTLGSDVGTIKETVSKIEVEHGQKLSALFDGYGRNAQKLDCIEAEVKKHDEFILKRIK